MKNYENRSVRILPGEPLAAQDELLLRPGTDVLPERRGVGEPRRLRVLARRHVPPEE